MNTPETGANHTLNTITPFFWDYLTLCWQEYKAADLHCRKSLLLIGCGAMPLTALAYISFAVAEKRGASLALAELLDLKAKSFDPKKAAELVGSLPFSPNELSLRITCIDRNADSISSAQKVIAALGLQSLFTFLVTEGEHYAVKTPFDLIHIASMAEPKMEVLNNILNQLDTMNECHLIVRSVAPDSLRGILYTPVTKQSLGQLVKSFPKLKSISSFSPGPGLDVVNSFEVLRYG